MALRVNKMVQKTVQVKVHEKVFEAVQEAKAAFLERDVAVEMVWLAVLAKESAFLMGPPGTAKSKLVETISRQVTKARYFRTLANKYSAPEQFFGPYKMTGFQEDRYERNTNGYAPAAELVFIDEAFKANAGVLNSCLTLMEERLFQMNGDLVPVPLHSFFAASNELPQDDDLGAFYDRLLVRLYIEPIQENGNLVKLLLGQWGKPKASLTLSELTHAQAEVERVSLPVGVAEATEIKVSLTEQGVVVSDRRFANAMKLVRANAWLNGRTEALVADLHTLQHIFWNTPDERQKVADVVMMKVNPLEREAREVYGMVLSALKSIEKAPDEDKTVVAAEALGKVNPSLKRLRAMVDQAVAEGHDDRPIRELLARAQQESLAAQNKYIRLLVSPSD
jgi:MoxR-like ATPase